MGNNIKLISRRRKVLFATIVVVVFFLGLEMLARFLLPSSDTRIHEQYQKLVTAIGLDTLNETMEFDADCFWRLKPNLRNFRVTGNVRGYTMDFTVTTHDGLRSPPVSTIKPGLRILALGDSCTFGIGVNDTQTWPAQLQAMFDQQGLNAQVINAGVPGYTAFQGKRFLESTGLLMKPDVVIATFGFNDMEVWQSRSDFETAQLMAIKGWESILTRSRFYYSLKRRYSSAMPRANNEQPTKSRPRLLPEEFQQCLVDIKRMCDQHNIRFILMVWPYRKQTENRHEGLVNYQRVVSYVCKQEKVFGLNLVDVFIKADKQLFVDHLHANAQGCRLAAESVLWCLKTLKITEALESSSNQEIAASLTP